MSSACKVALVVLCGCNRILGLHDVDLAPTPYFDALIDGTPSCPPAGTAPRFLSLVRQYVQQPCRDFSISASGTAVATCLLNGTFQTSIGAPGQQLDPILEIPSGLARPRLSSDDQRVYVSDGAGNVMREYTRSAAGWQLTQPNVVELPVLGTSTIARSPSGDRIVVKITTGTSLMMQELERGIDGSWYVLPTSFGDVPDLLDVTVTADGLRLIAGTRAGKMVYEDRPDVASSFGMATVLPDLPFLEDAFLTEDCTRVYATGLAQIAYFEAR